ncbi:MAG: winged helix-turn-helix transcriptional regulator [Clostridia bacterium]|nr:winged helix-turn-helix transcriptional regulator [Clostridia bacterium]
MSHPISLMRSVGKTRRAWQQYVRACALAAGIPDSYRTVIMYLYHHPGAGQRDIAEYAEITTSAVNQAVKSMQAEGYLCKETDPSDKRSSRLYLTDRSLAIAEKLHEQLAAADQGITALIGAKREAEMIALLEKVADYIRKDMTSC